MLILLPVAAEALSALPPASDAIANCRTHMISGECAVEWRGATLELLESGRNSITVKAADGAALRWTFSCSIDRVENSRTCSLQGGGITINRIYLGSGAVTNGVTWGGSKFPGSEKIAKIGSRPPMRWDADTTIYGAQAVRIIEAAKGGGPAIFRWFHWPDEEAHDEEVNFDNFELVWNLFKAAAAPAGRS